MIIDSVDEWGHFLHARKLLIDRLAREGGTPESIAKALSMDGDQVLLIWLTSVDPNRLSDAEFDHWCRDMLLDAHKALDHLGAPTTKFVDGTDRHPAGQTITLSVGNRIRALKSLQR